MTWLPKPDKATRAKLPQIPRIQRRKNDLEGLQERSITLDHRKANVETRVIPATLSSETPVQRWFGSEVLRHDEDSVDLSRASEGLPLLFNHNTDVFIGAVRNVRVDEGKLKGDLHFSENSRASEIFEDVRAGLLSNMSIGYKITDYDEARNGDITATSWQLYEASIAPVPADNSVGANRKVPRGTSKENTMDPKTDNNEALEARKAETDRIAGIREVFTRYTEPKDVELMTTLIGDGASVDEARKELLDSIGLNHKPASQASTSGQPTYEHSKNETRDQMMRDAMAVKFGIEDDAEKIKRCKGNNEFAGMTLIEMGRRWLQLNGERHTGSSREIADRILNYRVTQDTTDFASLMADVANMSLLKAYWDAPETWRTWASTSSVQDFKVNQRVNLSEFDTLPVVAEGASYTEGSFTDTGEPIQIATYGMNWSITREALINDSTSAFTRAPTAMGLAAARTVGNLVYSVLTTNAAMSDTELLFSAAHNNIVTPGGAIDADSVQAAKVAMALQQGPKGEATLGIRPQYLICPVALEGTANTLMSAQYNPASTAGTLEPNVVQNLLTVVSDHRLDTADNNAWYVAASPMTWDTVDVAFLNGNQTPYQERRQQDISNDSITYKVRIDAAAAPMDWRGLYFNDGGV